MITLSSLLKTFYETYVLNFLCINGVTISIGEIATDELLEKIRDKCNESINTGGMIEILPGFIIDNAIYKLQITNIGYKDTEHYNNIPVFFIAIFKDDEIAPFIMIWVDVV